MAKVTYLEKHCDHYCEPHHPAHDLGYRRVHKVPHCHNEAVSYPHYDPHCDGPLHPHRFADHVHPGQSFHRLYGDYGNWQVMPVRLHQHVGHAYGHSHHGHGIPHYGTVALVD